MRAKSRPATQMISPYVSSVLPPMPRNWTLLRSGMTRLASPPGWCCCIESVSPGSVDRNGVLQEQRPEDDGDDRHQLQEDVEAGARGVLEGIAHRVPDHRRAVRLGVLAAVIALLDELLGVVPRAAGVGHHQREQRARDDGSDEKAAERLGAEDHAHHD